MTNETTATPGRRGPKPGFKQRRDFERVCTAPDCPRKGEPFMGTERAIYCSRACNLRAWRARQPTKESTPDA